MAILCPGWVAQLVRTSSGYIKVVGSIPSQGTYERKPMNAWISGTTNWFLFSPHPPRSVKPPFWILFQVYCWFPSRWSQLLEDYCDPLVVWCFLAILFVFLKSYIVKVKVTSSSSYCLISRKKYLPSAPLRISRLSQNFYGFACSFACLLPVLQHTRPRQSASHLLPKGGAKGEICGLSLAHRFRPAFCARSQDVCQSLLSPLPKALTGSQPKLGVSAGGSAGETSPVDCGWVTWWSSQCP